MAITDELREWVTGAKPAVVDGCSISVGTMTYGCKKALLAIADRIDAEHESACGEAYGNGVQSVALPDMTATEALERRIDELCAENERLRQENQSISMAAYEIGYKNGSVHYELEHCPACKNIADIQEALAENARLRQLVRDVVLLAGVNGCDVTSMQLHLHDGDWRTIADRMHELGIIEEA